MTITNNPEPQIAEFAEPVERIVGDLRSEQEGQLDEDSLYSPFKMAESFARGRGSGVITTTDISGGILNEVIPVELVATVLSVQPEDVSRFVEVFHLDNKSVQSFFDAVSKLTSQQQRYLLAGSVINEVANHEKALAAAEIGAVTLPAESIAEKKERLAQLKTLRERIMAKATVPPTEISRA